MSRQFDYRTDAEVAAARMFAATVDADCIRARLAELGGPNAALLEHRADADSARFRVRHGLNTDDLPPAVRGFVPGAIEIDRLETWTRSGEGTYDAHADVDVRATPASATATMRLADKNPGTAGDTGTEGSTFHVHTDVTVRVPLLGGRIEESVGGQINQLLALETAFILDWAKRH